GIQWLLAGLMQSEMRRNAQFLSRNKKTVRWLHPRELAKGGGAQQSCENRMPPSLRTRSHVLQTRWRRREQSWKILATVSKQRKYARRLRDHTSRRKWCLRIEGVVVRSR